MNKASLRAVACLSLLGGCATSPSLPPIRSDETVAIVVTTSAQASGELPIRNLALGDNTKTGAGSGMVVGALSGLSCGPFAWLCVPGGLLLGGLTGTAAGAVVGVTGALSAENAAQLRDRVSHWRQSHDVLDALRGHVTERARKQWTVTTGAAGTEVAVEWQEQTLNSTRDEQIGFVLRVLVTVRTNGVQRAQKPYEYTSALSPLAVWLDERDDFLDGSIGSACQQIAAQLVSELAIR